MARFGVEGIRYFDQLRPSAVAWAETMSTSLFTSTASSRLSKS